MKPNSAQWNQASSELRKPAHDAWDAFDSRRAADPAALQVLRDEQPATPVGISLSPSSVPAITPCAFCCEPLLPNERYCSRCLRKVAVNSTEAHQAPPVASTVPHQAPPVAAPASGKAQGGSGAMYTLESPVRCPQCEKEIRTFKVLRVLRTQVSFTSTLPRKGYVIVCPECERILSAELSGLI